MIETHTFSRLLNKDTDEVLLEATRLLHCADATNISHYRRFNSQDPTEILLFIASVPQSRWCANAIHFSVVSSVTVVIFFCHQSSDWWAASPPLQDRYMTETGRSFIWWAAGDDGIATIASVICEFAKIDVLGVATIMPHSIIHMDLCTLDYIAAITWAWHHQSSSDPSRKIASGELAWVLSLSEDTWRAHSLRSPSLPRVLSFYTDRQCRVTPSMHFRLLIAWCPCGESPWWSDQVTGPFKRATPATCLVVSLVPMMI